MAECIITSVDSISESQPILATFQNGQLNSDKVDKLQCVALSNKNDNKKLVAISTEKMVYIGNDTSDTALSYTLLMIRNKKTNKVRVVPVSNVSLQPVLQNKNVQLDSTLSSNKSNVQDLNKQFGSKRTKRRTEQMERMRMNVSNVEKELEQTVAEIVIKPEDLVAPVVDENEKFYRPPINRDASTVEKIYNLKNIITRHELETLSEMTTEILENDIEDDKFIPFVTDNINKFKKLDHPKKLEKIAQLLYMDAIIKFFKMPVKSMPKRKQLIIEPYNSVISAKILDEFTVHTATHRTRPISMRDKATCYLIVLGLIILDFKLDLEALSKSIGVGVKKLMDVSRILGAQSGSSKNQIVLKLPIPPLPTFTGKRKK